MSQMITFERSRTLYSVWCTSLAKILLRFNILQYQKWPSHSFSQFKLDSYESTLSRIPRSSRKKWNCTKRIQQSWLSQVRCGRRLAATASTCFKHGASRKNEKNMLRNRTAHDGPCNTTASWGRLRSACGKAHGNQQQDEIFVHSLLRQSVLWITLCRLRKSHISPGAKVQSVP